MTRTKSLVSFALALTIAGAALAAESTKSESFDRDPGWEGFNNHIVPDRIPTVTQDFGYSDTNFAGKSKGEMGGRITRATKPAFYGQRIEPKTLNDKLLASGSFALTKSEGGGGVFFGWFNSNQQGGNGRPVGSLGMDFDFERAGGRLAVRLIAQTNRAAGTFITPFIPGKFRPTPIRNDGTRYSWKLDYDPAGNNGGGRFEFTLTSNNPKPDEFEGKTFTVDLPAGFKSESATFDHFGLMNGTKPGGQVTMYFDDVQHDGKSEDFTADPHWAESNNRDTYKETRIAGAHNFGFSEGTNYAGGAKAGEFGGDLWRAGKFAYYADKVSPLSLDRHLEASGKVMLLVGAPDSDVMFGWFSSEGRDDPNTEAGNFVGVHIGGPTRVGHWFSPYLENAKGTQAKTEPAPVLTPGKVFDWSIVYDPDANDGNGEMRVKLGEQTSTLPLKKGVKSQGGKFDRFGLWNTTIGGQLVRIFFDDVKYTAK